MGASVVFTYSAFFIEAYPELPEKVPTHLNSIGEVDRWGSKDSVWIAIGVNVLLSALIWFTARFPKFWNVPSDFREGNQTIFIEKSRTFLGLLSILISIAFSTMVFYILRYTFLKAATILSLLLIGPTMYLIFMGRKR